MEKIQGSKLKNYFYIVSEKYLKTIRNIKILLNEVRRIQERIKSIIKYLQFFLPKIYIINRKILFGKQMEHIKMANENFL